MNMFDSCWQRNEPPCSVTYTTRNSHYNRDTNMQANKKIHLNMVILKVVNYFTKGFEAYFIGGVYSQF